MIDKYRLILDNDSDESTNQSETEKKFVTIKIGNAIHVIKTRRDKPSTVDPTECGILEEMIVDDYCEQGFTMNWKKAKELYEKIMKKT